MVSWSTSLKHDGNHEECTTESVNTKQEVACEVWTKWFNNQVVMIGLLFVYEAI